MITSRRVIAALALAAACSSEKSTPRDGNDSDAEVTAEQAKAPILPPLTPLGKPATELEAEGWTAAEIPPELAARLRDSAPVEAELGSHALRRELRALAGNAPSFDRLGGLSDTVRLIERALMRLGAERREKVEAEIIDSLKRAMEPRDPDLDAVSTSQGLLPAGPLAKPAARPSSWQPSDGRELRIVFAAFRQPSAADVPQQGSQTRTFQLAPGVEGTETTSPDGSSVTTEVTRKGSNERGSAEVSMKGTATLPDEFEKQGEVGWKSDLDTKIEGTVDGASGGQSKGGGMEYRLSYCPDAAGHAKGRYKRWFRESLTASQKGVTYSQIITINAEFALTVQVNDEARATDLLVEGYTDVASEVGSRGGGNSTPIIIKGRGEARAQGVTPSDHNSLGSMHFRLPAGQSAMAHKFLDAGLTEELVNAIAAGRQLAKQAEQRWRNGACVEVRATPESKTLPYRGRTTVHVQVKHKREAGGSFPYPVRIMARRFNPSAVEEILGTFQPQGPLTAPAALRYTAPAKGSPQGRTWVNGYPQVDRTFPMSISRRGIGGSQFYAIFDSDRLGYALVIVHRVTSEKLGVERSVTMKAVVRELDTPDAEGNTFAGKGSYQGSARRYNPSCDNNMRTSYKTIPLVGKAKGAATADDLGGGQIGLVFSITPLDPPEDLPEQVPPSLGNMAFAGDSGHHTNTFEMQSDLCRGTLTHVTEWSAKRIK